jgi:hypothetical protein
MSENPTITIQGKQYSIPGLTTGQLRKDFKRYTEALDSLKAPGDRPLDTLTNYQIVQAEILFLALHNAYPHLTQDDVDTLDAYDVMEGLKAVIQQMASPNRVAPVKTKK